jgi:GT2 family glycosyltransferase
MSYRGSIVIVNYNSDRYLCQCLASSARHAPGAQVIVVDNASADASTRCPGIASGEVQLLKNRTNVGFSRAANQGIVAATRPLVVILNPDCVIGPDGLDVLAEELSLHPECGVAGPQIRNDDGSVQGSARGDPTLFTGFFGRSSLLTRLFPRSRFARRNVRTDADRARNGQSYRVDWVSGACMMTRRETIAAVGGFDEAYFLYWEDADLCRRVRTFGSTIRYVPAAVVVHSGAGSSRRAPALAVRAFHDSAYRYYATHVGRGPIVRAAAWILLRLRCRLKLLGLTFRG